MNDVQVGKEIRAAIKAGQVEKVVDLIGANDDRLRMMTPFGTWLHVAASAGQLAIVKRLVALGASVNARGGTFGGNALNEVASKGHLEIVEYLLSCGAEMDTSEPERNPLFSAIYGGRADVVRVLLGHGIDSRVRYTGRYMAGMDAVAFAEERGQREIAAMLRGGGRHA